MLNRLCRLGAAYASVLKFVDETDTAPGAYLRAFGTALDGVLQQYVIAVLFAHCTLHTLNAALTSDPLMHLNVVLHQYVSF